MAGIEESGDGGLVLKARVKAPPEKGKANAALTALIAKWLDVARTDCDMVAGSKSRLKQLLIRGDADELMDRLASRAAKLRSGG